jgi:predicted  nucleic acid-binding Zn-ribbon protein
VSIRDQIPSLEALANIDADIRRAEEQIGKQRGSLEGMRGEAKDLDARLKADRETLAQMERTRSDLSVEVRQMTQQIERSREKLQRARNEKEINAAQREIEELRKLHRDREDEVEKLGSAIDGAKKSIDGTETKLLVVMQKMEGSEEGAVKQLNELETTRATRLKEREDAVKKLPVALYRRYERVRSQRPHAIAATHDGTCLGCHLTLPPMMFRNMVPQLQFDNCPQCKRIIYYTPAPVRVVDVDQGSSATSRV